jgi:hypothetical protein
VKRRPSPLAPQDHHRTRPYSTLHNARQAGAPGVRRGDLRSPAPARSIILRCAVLVR